jgi:hypothetical protein
LSLATILRRYDINRRPQMQGDFSERDKCKPVFPENLIGWKFGKNHYWTEWRERGYGLWYL